MGVYEAEVVLVRDERSGVNIQVTCRSWLSAGCHTGPNDADALVIMNVKEC